MAGFKWHAASLKQTRALYNWAPYRLESDNESDDSSEEEKEEEEDKQEAEAEHVIPAALNASDRSGVLNAEWFSRTKYKEVESELLKQQNTQKLLEIETFPDVFEVALRTLQNYAKLLKVGLSDQEILGLLHDYIFGDPKTVTIDPYLRSDPDTFWREVHKIDKWTKFSALALHFVTLTTSEADVERLFSKQKQVMGEHSTSMGIGALDARLRLGGW